MSGISLARSAKRFQVRMSRRFSASLVAYEAQLAPCGSAESLGRRRRFWPRWTRLRAKSCLTYRPWRCESRRVYILGKISPDDGHFLASLCQLVRDAQAEHCGSAVSEVLDSSGDVPPAPRMTASYCCFDIMVGSGQSESSRCGERAKGLQAATSLLCCISVTTGMQSHATSVKCQEAETSNGDARTISPMLSRSTSNYRRRATGVLRILHLLSLPLINPDSLDRQMRGVPRQCTEFTSPMRLSPLANASRLVGAERNAHRRCVSVQRRHAAARRRPNVRRHLAFASQGPPCQ